MKLLFHDPIFFFFKELQIKTGGFSTFWSFINKKRNEWRDSNLFKKQKGRKRNSLFRGFRATQHAQILPLRCSSHTELEVTDIQNFRLPLRWMKRRFPPRFYMKTPNKDMIQQPLSSPFPPYGWFSPLPLFYLFSCRYWE
jgi:hypothetical protein